MKFLPLIRFFGKILLPGMASMALLFAPFIHPESDRQQTDPIVPQPSVAERSAIVAMPGVVSFTSFDIPETTLPALPTANFGNPAGCGVVAPVGSAFDRLSHVQSDLGNALDLAQTRQTYTWNGPLNTMVNVADDQYVFEFAVNQFHDTP